MGTILHILKWVSWKRDVYFAQVDHRGTNQSCPQCLTVTGFKELSLRMHQCPACGYQTDRDVAAAQVVLARGVSAVGHAVAKLLADGGGGCRVRMMQESSCL